MNTIKQFLKPLLSLSGRLLRLLRRRWRRLASALALLFLLFLALVCWPIDAEPYLVTHNAAELLDRHGRAIHTFLSDHQQWCYEEPLEGFSPRLAQATVAAEDRRFWSHRGVDPRAALRAFGQIFTHRRIHSGASTLTMQVVKLAGNPSHSVLGKLRQMVQALRLERAAGKRQILEAYLNHAPYGLNLTGAEAAARRYFGKPARELTLPEAALLAALPKAPSRLMPLGKGAARALKRRNFVLARMADEGFISEAERVRAAAAPLGAAWHAFPRQAPHLAHWLAPAARTRGHLTSTLDAPTQAMAEELLRAHLKQFNGEVRDGALIVIDVANAEVRAWTGAADFWSKRHGSQVDPVRARRSPGSALKPFIYGLAVEKNLLYPSEVLLDGTLDLGRYNPRNFDKNYHGLLPADAALRRSLNVPAVMVLRRVGVSPACDLLRLAGLTTLARPAQAYGLGLAMGNCEARLDQLGAAYRAVAALGEWRPLSLVRGAAPPASHRLFGRGTALALFAMLEQPLPGELDPGAGAVSAPPRVCWKTGTSTGNHDAWAFVFNGQYVVGVWLGNPDGHSSRRLVGAEAALPLAARVFRRLPVDPSAAWPDPGEDQQSVEICAVSGLPSSGWCEHTRRVALPRGAFLGRVCDVHWPEGPATGGGARPRVVERWPASPRDWDLAKIEAPVVAGKPREEWMAGPINALQILSPPDSARFILTGEPGGDKIRLRSSNDGQGPVHWYLDGRFLATAQPQLPVLLGLKAGRHRLVCMTPHGETAQVRFQVTPPSNTDPGFAQ